MARVTISFLFVGLFLAQVAHAAAVELLVRVVHANSQNSAVDPKLTELVKDFKDLKFTGYQLKDEAKFNLELKATGRMQLPSGAWMTIQPQGMDKDGKLRLALEIKDLKFKSTVAVSPGGTVAVGGPAFDNGALILAVTRPGAQAAN